MKATIISLENSFHIKHLAISTLMCHSYFLDLLMIFLTPDCLLQPLT